MDPKRRQIRRRTRIRIDDYFTLGGASTGVPRVIIKASEYIRRLMGPLGVQEMLGIFVIALLLFGPKKLPELGRMLGKAVSEFRRAKNELKSTFESHLSELEKEVQTEKYSEISNDYSSAHYPYRYDENGRQEPDYNSLSVPPESNESHEAETSQSYVTNSTETQAAEIDRNTLSHDSPVPGTVPRSNGFQPAGSGPLATEEKNSA
jgi:sec-independent protein translocase protein TatA